MYRTLLLRLTLSYYFVVLCCFLKKKTLLFSGTARPIMRHDLRNYAIDVCLDVGAQCFQS